MENLIIFCLYSLQYVMYTGTQIQYIIEIPHRSRCHDGVYGAQPEPGHVYKIVACCKPVLGLENQWHVNEIMLLVVNI